LVGYVYNHNQYYDHKHVNHDDKYDNYNDGICGSNTKPDRYFWRSSYIYNMQ
jgi:hypothetical protein